MGSIKVGVGFSLVRSGIVSGKEICEFAERVEDVGLDSIWPSDHIVTRQPSLDVACLMALFAARTERIKMGPSVLILPPRDPVQVAKAFATLDHLSGGRRRVIMAVGLGGDARDTVVSGIAPGERAARMREGVEVMRRLWSGPRVSFEGKFYRFADVTIEPRPVGGPLDVWIGGNSEAAMRRVARWGDGWMPSFVTPEEFGKGLATIARFAEEHGRAFDADEAGVLALTHVDADGARARARAAEFFARSPLPAEALAERCIFGTPEEAVERIGRYVAEGCRKFILFPIAGTGELVPQIELYGKAILPRLAG
ncbi:MAG TPA: LLM class flavin-dependent oxidoreductase [Candidatus Binatia bacterium]|nr:LLM class flavin-dependent oxidoreductase [Candidatus Binatia bacterium]